MVRSMGDVRTDFTSPKDHVAVNTVASGLAWKAVARNLLHNVAHLEHLVAAKASVHLKVARRVGRCIAVTAAKAGWGVDLGIGLAGISSRSNSAVRVRVRILAVHAVLNHVLNSVAAPDPSSLGSSAGVNTTEQAPGTSNTRCISRRMVA